MKNSEYFSKLGATLSCALRAAPSTSHEMGHNTGELVPVFNYTELFENNTELDLVVEA